MGDRARSSSCKDEDANPDLIAERCWTLWYPVRGDVPIGFARSWALICEKFSSRLSGSIEKEAKAVELGRLRSALGAQADDLSDQAVCVLGAQLVQLARVCSVLGGERNA